MIAGVGIATSSFIAVLGLGAVHALSVRRQRRDEFFKRIQDCLTLLERIGREALKVWRRPRKDEIAQSSLELLQADFDSLTHRLALLHRLRPEFSVQTALVDLKREAMLDVEMTDRRADAVRADRALRLAQNLAREVLDQYDRIYR